LNTIIDLSKDSKSIIISLVCVLLIYCSLPYVQHAVQYHAVHVTTKHPRTRVTNACVLVRIVLGYLASRITKEVKVRGGKAPYMLHSNALKVMPIVPSLATFYDRERPWTAHRVSPRIGASGVPLTPARRCWWVGVKRLTYTYSFNIYL
jgi:hypothetical protein